MTGMIYHGSINTVQDLEKAAMSYITIVSLKDESKRTIELNALKERLKDIFIEGKPAIQAIEQFVYDKFVKKERKVEVIKNNEDKKIYANTAAKTQIAHENTLSIQTPKINTISPAFVQGQHPKDKSAAGLPQISLERLPAKDQEALKEFKEKLKDFSINGQPAYEILVDYRLSHLEAKWKDCMLHLQSLGLKKN